MHYTPHGVVDVQGLGCDFLVASAYKFFGPHIGFLYGRHELVGQDRRVQSAAGPVGPTGEVGDRHPEFRKLGRRNCGDRLSGVAEAGETVCTASVGLRRGWR